MNDERQRVLSLIREYYGRVAYSHKTLEKDRELLSGDVRFKKWVNIVILTFTSTGVLISLSTDVLWIKIATAFTALASTGYAIYEISFTPELEILEYREAA